MYEQKQEHFSCIKKNKNQNKYFESLVSPKDRAKKWETSQIDHLLPISTSHSAKDQIIIIFHILLILLFIFLILSLPDST